MFLGHMAVGFAAKRVAPKTSLGVLLAAGLFWALLAAAAAAWIGPLFVLFLFWAAWFDRHREVVRA
jgi:hypothetical protein